MGWSRGGQVSWADRVAEMGLAVGSEVDIVYRLRRNRHPSYGGLELELIDMAGAARESSDPALATVSGFA